jgi:hypothetical protein
MHVRFLYFSKYLNPFAKAFLFAVSLDSCIRADLPLTSSTNGFGLILLSSPLTRAELIKTQDTVLPTRTTWDSPPQSALWLTLLDGTRAAIDWDVTRFLPDHLLKVFFSHAHSPWQRATFEGQNHRTCH